MLGLAIKKKRTLTSCSSRREDRGERLTSPSPDCFFDAEAKAAKLWLPRGDSRSSPFQEGK